MARPKKIPSAAAVPRGRITRRSSRPQLNSRTASASAKSPAKPPPEESDNPPQDPSDSSQEEEDQDMDSESDEPPEPVSKASSRAVKKRRTSLGSNIAVVIDVKRTTRQSQHASSSTSVASGASSEFRVFDEPGAVETPATLRSATSTRASSRVALQKTNDEEEDLISDEEEIALSTVIKGKGVSKNLSISTPRRAGLRSSTAPNSVSKSQVRDVSSGKHNTDKPDPQTVSDSELSELSDLSDVSAFDPNSEDCGSGEDEDEDEDEDLPTATDNTGLAAASAAPGPSTASNPPPANAPSRRRGRRQAKPNTAERHLTELYHHHPYLETIWQELAESPPIPVEKAQQPEGLSLTMLPFQLEGLNWLRQQEQTVFNGGILADEMGMGKTIQTIALLMEQPRPKKPTLVVAPTVALIQWRNEIEKHTNSALKVLTFHGQAKETKINAINKFDVVLTTYGSLESAFRKQNSGFKRKAGLFKEPSVLHKVNWHRVVLDEAHNIKDRSCNTSRSVFALKTRYKLCLSGTPLQNRIGELFSLLRFLEADPFSMYFCKKCPCKSMTWKFKDHRHCELCGHRPMEHLCFFNYAVLHPISAFGNEGKGKEGYERLRSLLGAIMLRRTKAERADDLGLPPRVIKVRRDYFNEEELDLYESVYSDSQRRFDTYAATGVVLNNYANIFSLITRMRQIADHPDLVLKRHSQEGSNSLVCCICDEEAEEAIKSKCRHTFCRLCVQKYVDAYAGGGSPDCPGCHIPLSIDLTQPALEADYELVKRGSIINRIDMSNWRSSTKIEALVEELAKLRNKTCTIKSIVFSQFTSMLQLVEWRLRRAGFLTVMLEGSMSPTQRDASIKYFMENVEVEVFLVSLKAGGVALNLVEASQVFILDPWWNPSVEWQSGDRIHRIGQTRNCRITRLVIEDSIESRIIQLQDKKANMINATIGGDQGAMDKLSVADMQFLFHN